MENTDHGYIGYFIAYDIGFDRVIIDGEEHFLERENQFKLEVYC